MGVSLKFQDKASATHLILDLGLLHLVYESAVEVPQDVGFGVALHLAEQRHRTRPGPVIGLRVRDHHRVS